jgi:hypothetical protein
VIGSGHLKKLHIMTMFIAKANFSVQNVMPKIVCIAEERKKDEK